MDKKAKSWFNGIDGAVASGTASVKGPDYDRHCPKRKQVVEKWHERKALHQTAKRKETMVVEAMTAQKKEELRGKRAEAAKRYSQWRAKKAARQQAEREAAEAQQQELESVIARQEARHDLLSKQLRRNRGVALHLRQKQPRRRGTFQPPTAAAPANLEMLHLFLETMQPPPPTSAHRDRGGAGDAGGPLRPLMGVTGRLQRSGSSNTAFSRMGAASMQQQQQQHNNGPIFPRLPSDL